MKYARIFLLHFQQVFEYRSRSFVWFLIALFNPLLYLLFWYGAISSGGDTSGVELSQITSYYFLLIIATAFLLSHVEEPVAFEDIQKGLLTNYLLRPLSYYWFKFIEEIPYRLLQGSFGMITFILLSTFLSYSVVLAKDFTKLIPAIIITMLAYFIMHTFKMIVGLTAFWFTDARGFQQVVAVVLLLMGGFIVPLNLFPEILKQIVLYLPFTYMIYVPIVAFQGVLSQVELLRAIIIQCFWLAAFLLVYKQMWARGVRLFTGVGR